MFIDSMARGQIPMSLRDQLQKAGVVSAKQAKKAERQQRQASKGSKRQKPNQITEAQKSAYKG